MITRRKLIAASLFFTLFGAVAYLPPLVLLFRLDVRVMGIPIETVYVFALWIVLVAGARWFSRVLPDDRPQAERKPGTGAGVGGTTGTGTGAKK